MEEDAPSSGEYRVLERCVTIDLPTGISICSELARDGSLKFRDGNRRPSPHHLRLPFPEVTPSIDQKAS
jgi:hypothetical protein